MYYLSGSREEGGFALEEFYPHADVPDGLLRALKRDEPTPVTIRCQLLADELLVLRTAWAEKVKNAAIIITSGVRDRRDHIRLKNAGYAPSDTSDHLDPGVNWRASGAVDIVPVAGSAGSLGKLARTLVHNGTLSVGQLILEDSNGKQWLHISAAYEDVFGDLGGGQVRRWNAKRSGLKPEEKQLMVFKDGRYKPWK